MVGAVLDLRATPDYAVGMDAVRYSQSEGHVEEDAADVKVPILALGPDVAAFVGNLLDAPGIAVAALVDEVWNM